VFSRKNKALAAAKAPVARAVAISGPVIAVAAIAELLEQRTLFSGQMPTVTETEPNDSAPAANVIALSTSPTIIGASISNGSDADYFKFTLSQRSGVFFDIDSRETGLSTTLDSILTLFNSTGTAQVDQNDDGRDFDTFHLNDTSATPLQFGDSAMYDDLAAGTYFIRVTGDSGSMGNYQLKITADSTYTSSVPVLNSDPGAADTLYLDFNGYSATDAWGTYSIPAYDLNGNAAEWTPAERLAIQNVWAVVADDFSPFNINVTNSYSGSYTPDATAYRMVIGNSNGSDLGLQPGTGGAAFNNSYASLGPTAKTGFVFANSFQDDPSAGISGQITAAAIEMGNTAAQEFGLALGLHRYGGTNSQPQAIMQADDSGLNRERWTSGNTSSDEPPVMFQDDVSVIASPTNTLGYRADDNGNTRTSATVLTPVGNAYTTSGVIEQTSDVDFFRFTASGSTTITLNIPENLGHLDGRLDLYSATGSLLLSADPSDQLGASIDTTLAGGTYFLGVSSHGDTGEIGQYGVEIDTTPVALPTGAISGRAFVDVTLNNVYEPGQGDSPLGGVTVFLDANHNGQLDGGEVSTVTAGDGTYSFAGLVDGTYDIREVTPSGYVAQSQGRVIDGGQTYSDVNFGNFPIIYMGSADDDTYTLRLKSGDPSTVEIVQSLGNAAPVIYSAPLSVLPSLTFTPGDGNDALTIDDAMPFPVSFSGGTNPAYTDDLTINAGTYTFASDAQLTTANLDLTIGDPAATVNFATTQHLKSLSITAGSASMAQNGSLVLYTDALSITGGNFDLKDNDMVIRNGVLGSWTGSAYDGVTGLLQSGRNAGTWDGTGIITSMPDAQGASPLTVLGVATGSNVLGIAPAATHLWDGETVDGNSILVKYTYAGDANLSGNIDADDYFQIDHNYGHTTPDRLGYFNGDSNYDGMINGDDYFTIDANYVAQDAPL